MDTIEITRFTFNPRKKRRAGIVRETWLVEGDRWVRGSRSVCFSGPALYELPAARVRPRHRATPQSTQSLGITAAGRRALGLEPALTTTEIRPVPRKDKSADELWVPAIPRAFVEGNSPRPLPRRREASPFRSLVARAAHGG